MPTPNEIREIQKAHELFMRAVARFFGDQAEKKGGILETEGLLHAIGSQEITNRIISTGKFEDTIDVKTCDTLLKKCIENILPFLSQIAPEEIEELQDAYKKAINDSEKEEALKNFISALANSNDFEKIRIAEMLYTYIRLGKKISNHANVNSMGIDNVSSILGGSFEQLFYREHGADHLTQIKNAGDTLKKALQGDHFDKPFSEAYFSETYAAAAEDALLSEAKKVVRSRLTSTMARKIRRELLQLKANEDPANFIDAAINILKNCPAEQQELYKQRILNLCSADFKGVVEKELTGRKKEWKKQEYVIDEILKKDAGDITFEEFLRLKKEQERLQNLGENKETLYEIEHKIQNLREIKKFSFTAPESSDDISVKAISWNMGNKEATKAAVDDFISQYFSYGPLPAVIAISTQEELAPTGRCLHEKLLNKLNEGIENEDEKYVLVKYEFHKTTAGANNSARTLAIATTTDQNRVSSAILVKKPYTIKDTESRICYEPGKEEGGNKSFIRIKGKVVTPDEKELDISVTGCHLDSNSDKKRRDHANVFFEGEASMSKKNKDFSQIYQEASSFILIQGDFNTRDNLYKDGSTRSDANPTSFQSQGLDFDKNHPSITLGNQNIHGTYGFKFSRNKKQILSSPDPRGRKNVAKGGFLDRIVCSTGLSMKSVAYQTKVQPAYFRASKKRKWFYHGSDHLPVIRDVHITPPNPNASKSEKIAIVAAYIEKRLPDYRQEIADLQLLANAKNADELKHAINQLQYHDSDFTPSQFLKLKYGIDLAGGNLFSKIKEKLSEKEVLQKLSEEKRDALKAPNDTLTKKELEHLFNQLTLANKLRDKALEILADPKVPVEVKVEFMALANKVIDLAHSQAMKNDSIVPLENLLNDNKPFLNANRSIPGLRSFVEMINTNVIEPEGEYIRKGKSVIFHTLRQRLVGSSPQNLTEPTPEDSKEKKQRNTTPGS